MQPSDAHAPSRAASRPPRGRAPRRRALALLSPCDRERLPSRATRWRSRRCTLGRGKRFSRSIRARWRSRSRGDRRRRRSAPQPSRSRPRACLRFAVSRSDRESLSAARSRETSLPTHCSITTRGGSRAWNRRAYFRTASSARCARAGYGSALPTMTRQRQTSREAGTQSHGSPRDGRVTESRRSTTDVIQGALTGSDPSPATGDVWV